VDGADQTQQSLLMSVANGADIDGLGSSGSYDFLRCGLLSL